ncbi:10015_t:CDS:2, partial [Funneliformis mosseae]
PQKKCKNKSSDEQIKQKQQTSKRVKTSTELDDLERALDLKERDLVLKEREVKLKALQKLQV